MGTTLPNHFRQRRLIDLGIERKRQHIVGKSQAEAAAIENVGMFKSCPGLRQMQMGVHDLFQGTRQGNNGIRGLRPIKSKLTTENGTVPLPAKRKDFNRHQRHARGFKPLRCLTLALALTYHQHKLNF